MTVKPNFLSIQATYSHAHVALFTNTTCIDAVLHEHSRASSYLLSYCDGLLKKHSLSLQNISFIAIDRGPGAFTSLRVAIATVNGIAFAQQIPLVGVNGLYALSTELVCAVDSNTDIKSHEYMNIVLLNAYNNDVYYHISMPGKPLEQGVMGCKNIDEVIELIFSSKHNGYYCLTGNAVPMHLQKLKQGADAVLGKLFHWPSQTASAQSIGLLGYELFLKQSEPVFKIEPLYLKSQKFAIRS